MTLSTKIGENGTKTLNSDEMDDSFNQTMLLNALAFTAIGLFAGLSTFGSASAMGIVGERLTRRLRIGVFKNILRQDGAYFDDPSNGTGKLTLRLATDAPAVQAAIDARLADVLQGVVSLIAGLSVAFYFGWNVAPISFATALILVIIHTSVSGYLKRRTVSDLKLAEESSRIATEAIVHVKTVQSLTRQQYLYEAFCLASKAPQQAAISRSHWESFTQALYFGFVPLNFAVMYYFGMVLIRHGFTTPFTVFQVIEALNMASVTMIQTANYFPEYMRAKIAAGLMFEMMRKESRIDGLSEQGLKTPINGSVDAKGVYFAYPNNEKQFVLNGLSVSVPPGKTLALVGPSGCGKSTVIQLLYRFYDSSSGRLSIDGIDIQRFNIGHLRSSMALVGQEPVLFNLTIRENIAYGLDCVSMEQIVAAAKFANIHSFVESLPLKYETPVGSRGAFQLSGGQKQRIAIARAIIRNPKIILLDEATSALDTESEKIVQEALDKARNGRTCIVIAHRLSTVKNADLIVVIRDGRVAEMGNHQQLVSRRGFYHGLVKKQII